MAWLTALGRCWLLSVTVVLTGAFLHLSILGLKSAAEPNSSHVVPSCGLTGCCWQKGAKKALDGGENSTRSLLEDLGQSKTKQKVLSQTQLIFSCLSRTNREQGLFQALPPTPVLPWPEHHTQTADSPLNSCLLAVGWKEQWS